MKGFIEIPAKSASHGYRHASLKTRIVATDFIAMVQPNGDKGCYITLKENESVDEHGNAFSTVLEVGASLEDVKAKMEASLQES